MRAVTLIITMDENGDIRLQGPVSELGLCYGMLELAKDAIRAHNAKGQELVKVGEGLVVPPGRM